MPTLFFDVATDPGLERDHNEDAVEARVLSDGSRILVVCDGMGGHEAGEHASRSALGAICDHLATTVGAPPYERIYKALVAGNHAVLEEAVQRQAPSMGTTAVVCLWMAGRAWVGWVGDSRFYQLRRGRIHERSEDHTRVRQLVVNGVLSPEEGRNHPDAHILTQALGGGEASQKSFKPEVWQEAISLEEGDVLLLGTDGLHDLVEDDELYDLVQGLTPGQATESLVRVALERGGHDNISVIVAVEGRGDIPRVGAAEEALPPPSPPSPPGALPSPEAALPSPEAALPSPEAALPSHEGALSSYTESQGVAGEAAFPPAEPGQPLYGHINDDEGAPLPEPEAPAPKVKAAPPPWDAPRSGARPTLLAASVALLVGGALGFGLGVRVGQPDTGAPAPAIVGAGAPQGAGQDASAAVSAPPHPLNEVPSETDPAPSAPTNPPAGEGDGRPEPAPQSERAPDPGAPRPAPGIAPGTAPETSPGEKAPSVPSNPVPGNPSASGGK